MDYTKNYHLPQWVREDRILMEDFNDAMANIEKGLDSVQSAAVQAENTAAAQSAARLQKLGFDLCQVNAKLLAGGAAVGKTKCLTFNGLSAPEEKSRVSGFLCTLDRQGARLGPQTVLTMERLNAEASNWTLVGKTVPNDYRHAASNSVNIHCSQSGTVTRLQVWDRNTSIPIAPQMVILCTDTDTGEEVYRKDSFSPGSQWSDYAEFMVDVEIPLEAGHNYYLELCTYSDLLIGTIGFGTDKNPSLVGTVVSEAATSGTIQESLTLDGPAHIALAVVHYKGGSAAPALTAGGKSLASRAVRQGTSVLGESCTEREYYLAGEWSGTVPLTVSCASSTTDLTICDVEFCLI